MSTNMRRPKGFFQVNPQDFLFITNIFDGVHRLHKKLTERMGLDVYRDSVVNLTSLEYRFSVLVQKFPKVLNSSKILGAIGQEPFYLRVAQKDDGTLKGALYAIQSSEDPSLVTLDNVGVVKADRETGIDLVRDFMAWANENSYQKVKAEVLCNNNWSFALASELDIAPKKLVLAKNINTATEKPSALPTVADRKFVKASIKHQSNRSWYKHSTLKLEFNDSAKEANPQELVNKIRRAVSYGVQNGCALVEAEIDMDDGAMKAILEYEGFKSFKYIFEKELSPALK